MQTPHMCRETKRNGFGGHRRVVACMKAWDGVGTSEKGELSAMGMKRGKWVCMTG